MKQLVVDKELKRIESYLFNESNWQAISLTRVWTMAQPSDAGVYMLFENGKPVYVGESGNISGRITDMLDSRHHTIRRTIGEKRFSSLDGYTKASSKSKHPAHIESLIEETLSNFKLCVLPISIGRKEFEEYMFTKYPLEFNRKLKRGSKKT